jgi:hypothetical protein
MSAISRSFVVAGAAAAVWIIAPAHAILQLAFDINGIPFARVITTQSATPRRPCVFSLR